MILLAIDTSTRYAGVGLDTGDGSAEERVWRSEQNHGRELMPAVMELLKARDLSPTDVTHLAVATGPGGFSALRVGISTVKGLAMPRDLPVAGVPTHEIEIEPYLDRPADSPLYSMLPAGRKALAWTRFDGTGEPQEVGLATPEELVRLLEPDARICGEGAELMIGLVANEAIIGRQPPTRRPASLLRIASRMFERGEATDPAALRPIYARAPSISTPKPPR